MSEIDEHGDEAGGAGTSAEAAAVEMLVAEEGTSTRLASIIESLLFVAGAPLPLRKLVEVLNGPSVKEVKAALAALSEACEASGRGVRLAAVAGGFQLRSVPENAEWVRALTRERPTRLGRAAMETLAIVAYKQPVTRAEVEAIRGVDADAALGSLLAKRMIKIAGRKDAIGRPLLYATTAEFLEVFGLNDLRDLPALKEIGAARESEDDTLSHDDDADPAAEGAQPGGRELAPPGRDADPQWAGPGEWPDGGGAGHEGGSGPGPDHR